MNKPKFKVGDKVICYKYYLEKKYVKPNNDAAPNFLREKTIFEIKDIIGPTTISCESSPVNTYKCVSESGLDKNFFETELVYSVITNWRKELTVR